MPKIRDLNSKQLEDIRYKIRKAKGLGMDTTHIMLADREVSVVNKQLDLFLSKHKGKKPFFWGGSKL